MLAVGNEFCVIVKGATKRKDSSGARIAFDGLTKIWVPPTPRVNPLQDERTGECSDLVRFDFSSPPLYLNSYVSGRQ